LLLEDETGPLTAEQREFLEVVRSNSARLMTLVNDLLDISRIESGMVEPGRTPVDLPAVIYAAATTLRPRFEAKGQTLHLDLPPHWPRVLASADRIMQTLVNFPSNATKYPPAGGSVAVSAYPADREVRVDVRDTGIGLSPEEQSRLFTKFYRAQNR